MEIGSSGARFIAPQGGMADLPNADDILKLAGVLAPGIVILWIRGRFKDISPIKWADNLLSYAVVSVAYNAAAYPIFHAKGWIPLSPWFWQLTLYFIFPLIVGLSIVFVDKSEKFYDWAAALGLMPVHHTPTAWDYTFRKRPPSYVIVHLEGGATVTGSWDDGSFASSTAGDRDVFISRMWRVSADDAWEIIEPPRSILICGGSIRMIEFIKGGNDG
jgi:roadblock/LC7 domain-containing protein